MARVENQLQLNLGLDLIPNINNVPRGAFDATLRIYNTIRLLASAVDSYTGNNKYTTEEIAELAAKDAREHVALENYCSIYLEAAQNMSYGQLIQIGTDGKAYLAINATRGILTPFSSPAVAFVADASKLAGEMVKVCYRGVIGVSGAITNRLYYLSSTTSGGIGSFNNDYVLAQSIAIGISSTNLYFYGLTRGDAFYQLPPP